jgi:hypothetical protein
MSGALQDIQFVNSAIHKTSNPLKIEILERRNYISNKINQRVPDVSVLSEHQVCTHKRVGQFLQLVSDYPHHHHQNSISWAP